MTEQLGSGGPGTLMERGQRQPETQHSYSDEEGLAIRLSLSWGRPYHPHGFEAPGMAMTHVNNTM